MTIEFDVLMTDLEEGANGTNWSLTIGQRRLKFSQSVGTTNPSNSETSVANASKDFVLMRSGDEASQLVVNVSWQNESDTIFAVNVG